MELDKPMQFEDLLMQAHAVNLHDKAKTLSDCINDELEMALQKVNDYKRNAEITIKLNIRQGDRQQVSIIADVTSKVPKGCVTSNVFYQDMKDGGLFVDDPAQTKLINVTKLNAERHAKGAVND